MVYKITLSSNPRILGMISVIILLPIAGIISFFFIPILLALVFTALGSYFAYHLVKFIRNILDTSIETSDERILCNLDAGEKTSMEWSSITHSGYCTQKKEKPVLFLYNENIDKLLTIPSEFNGFSNLVEEIRNHMELPEIQLDETDTISEYLKKQLAPEIADQTEPEEIEPSDS